MTGRVSGIATSDLGGSSTVSVERRPVRAIMTVMTTLYRDDPYSWALEQAEALRAAGQTKINTPRAVDWANLATEVEDMGIEQANKLRSSLKVLLMHLLKWQFQPAKRSKSWRRTIIRERGDIADHLEDNPGLAPRQRELFEQAWPRARRDAQRKTGLSERTFPRLCPYTMQDALDAEFWPEADSTDTHG